MAKRRRLTPGGPGAAEGAAPLETKSLFVLSPARPGAAPPRDGAAPSAPIAQAAGESAMEAAFEAVAGELREARAEERLVQALPLSDVAEDWLIRDRSDPDPHEMRLLEASLAAHGQRVPVEVAETGDAARPYGLISGWRRLTALRRLHAAGTGPATVLAIVRHPPDLPATYLAMVEENEIRAGLSYWERAALVRGAAAAGVFEDEGAALKSLYGGVSRAKRSKIGSFVRVVAALEGAVRAPAAIGERLGLQLARAVDAGRGGELRAALRRAEGDGREEQAVLLEALAPKAPPETPAPPADPPEGVRLRLDERRGRITLTGTDVGAALAEELEAWLDRRVSRAKHPAP